MTVRAATSDELIKFRGDKQYSEVFAIPRVPNVIYTARLDVVPSSTDLVAEITVDSGSGTVADILPDMKILVGTSAGEDDLGFCRVRATPSLTLGAGDIKIGELSHIDWQADCYLTIVDDYDIFPRHLRIVSGVPYIDYETAYSDQHEDFQPVVNMGGHRVLLLSGSTVEHDRSADTSMVFDGTVSSYLWEAPDSSSITNGTTATATIEYDAVGHYCEYLTITTDDGKTWKGVRYVFVIDPDDIESNINRLQVTEDIDGLTATFEMLEDSALSDFKHRSFVVIFSKDYYDSTQGSVGYNEYEENIVACGRISDERMSWNDEIGVVEFTVKDWKYWMGKITGFPFGLERALSAPDSWTSMTGLNVDRAVWALLHEYATVSRICDLHFSGDTRYAQELSTASSNLASQIEEIALSSILADLVFDRFGAGWLRVEPQVIPEADRSGWAVVQAITSDDYQDGLNVEINTYEEVSQVNLSGVAVSQYGDGTPIFSLSYGRIFSTFGDPATETNLLLESQAQANSLAGLMMGWTNRKFDNLAVSFVGNNRMFSIAEYCRASINILASSNPRGVAYNGYLCPRSISYKWNAKSGEMTTDVDFQDESVEKISVTGDFPPSTDLDEIDFSFEPPSMPPIPPIALIPLPISFISQDQPRVVVIGTDQGVFYTETFNETDPTWLAMNSGLTSNQMTTLEQLVHTSEGKLYMLSEWTSGRGFLSLMGVGALGGTWRQLYHADSFPIDPNKSGIWGVSKDPTLADRIAFIAGRRWSWSTDGEYGEQRMGFGNIGGVALGGTLLEYSHLFRVALERAGDNWFIHGVRGTGIQANLSTPTIIIATVGGAYVNHYAVTGSNASDKGMCRMGIQKKVMFWDDGGTSGYNTSIGADGTHSTGLNPNPPYAVSFAPDGLNAMGAQGAVAYKTTDGGASWNSVSGVIPNGFDVWENCNDSNRWIFAGGTEVRLTMDNGASYLNKAGNLSTIAPLVDIVAARFIS